ncbi:head decoration protein [Pseudoalteromonas sp. DL2-H6]|nr:head decoration protein [Pseudoalteromonas sp. OF5H-5]MCF2832039.1 head decoration protein [Pseudoalteromonas sp. DL2-H6]MCF2925910.1 head decoration protein [Pseudoalteromonas sp. DL2-H1]
MSRDEALLSGGNYLTATVLGEVTASGEMVQFDPAGSDGSEVAAAILYRAVDASAATKKVVVNARLTAVRASSLVWPDGITEEEKTVAIKQLNANHIIVR